MLSSRLIRRDLTGALFLWLLVFGVNPAMAYEEPRFEVVAEFEDFELRQYQPFLIAEVEISSAFDDAGNKAFNTLFEYISGANRGATKMEMTVPVKQAPQVGEKIEMTAPVRQRSSAEAQSHLVSFVLPSRYDLASAPEPTDPNVRIREVPSRLMAARRYTGFWSEKRYRENEARLLTALKAEGFDVLGRAEWARYNSPWSLWFLRRNEVLVEVRKGMETER